MKKVFNGLTINGLVPTYAKIHVKKDNFAEQSFEIVKRAALSVDLQLYRVSQK